MKITIATGIYPPDIGGPATYSKLLHDELPKRGIGVEVISFGDVRHLPKGISHIVYIFKVLKACRDSDIVFAQDTVSAALPALAAARIAKKRFIVRVPGDYAWEQAVQRYGVSDSIGDFQSRGYGWRVELIRSVQRFVVGSADLVITPSLYFKELVSKWDVRQKNVIHIYNGIDLKDMPENIGKPEAKAMISVGRLVPWKGFLDLIDVMDLLPDWKLYIAGSGPDEGVLRSRAEKYRGRVMLLGSMKREDLIAKMQDCDVFVLNTRFESFSFQIVEAMAAGVPVVSTNIGNIPEIIEDGKNGILVKPGDTGAIIQAVKRLSSDAQFRGAIVEAAMKRSKDFSIKKTLDELVKAVQNP